MTPMTPRELDELIMLQKRGKGMGKPRPPDRYKQQCSPDMHNHHDTTAFGDSYKTYTCMDCGASKISGLIATETGPPKTPRRSMEVLFKKLPKVS